MAQRHTLDARNLLCPMPVIRVQGVMESLAPDEELVVLCTDPGAMSDVPAWCQVHGHEVLEVREDRDADEIRITIRAGPGDDDGRGD
ncbi:MAG: sulfurtransferase TusA family protein [Thiotrichales bacterium]|nr:sulfurtransferase TusA family protein [Thiotrichales bacterium]